VALSYKRGGGERWWPVASRHPPPPLTLMSPPMLSLTCNSGTTFDVTEMTPSPPSNVNSKAFESSPDNNMKSGPQSSRKTCIERGVEGRGSKNRRS
jgi:hypothetical protein